MHEDFWNDRLSGIILLQFQMDDFCTIINEENARTDKTINICSNIMHLCVRSQTTNNKYMPHVHVLLVYPSGDTANPSWHLFLLSLGWMVASSSAWHLAVTASWQELHYYLTLTRHAWPGPSHIVFLSNVLSCSTFFFQWGRKAYVHLREILDNQGSRFYLSQLGPKSQFIDYCWSAIDFSPLREGEKEENRKIVHMLIWLAH